MDTTVLPDDPFWHEHRDQCGVVYYAGPRKEEGSDVNDDMVKWLLPSRISKVLQHVGQNAVVMRINQEGDPDPQGSFWIFGTPVENSSSFITDVPDAEDVLKEGDRTRCESSLRGLLRRGRELKDPNKWDYMELFSGSRLLDSLQEHGLRVPKASGCFHEQAGWKVARAEHRRRCREAIVQHRPQVLTVQLPPRKLGTNAVLNQVALDFAGEIAQEQFTNYINKFLDFNGADPRRTSFSVSVNARSRLHVDCHNEDGAYNSVIALGDHRGGELWMDVRCQPLGGSVLRKEVRELPSGELLEGHVLQVRAKMTTFDPHYYHEVLPWKGSRVSIASYVAGAIHKTDPSTKRKLRSLGFRLSEKATGKHLSPGWSNSSSLYQAALALVNHSATGLSFPTFDDTEDVPEDAEEEQQETIAETPFRPDQPSPQITEAQKRLIHKVHVNVGHPPKERFLRMLKAAGTLPHVLKYVKDEHTCDQCSIKRRADNRHRARCPRTFEFNRILSIDVFYVNFGQYRVPILNMVDSGTGYHVTQRLPIMEGGQGGTPASDATWKAFLATWIRFLGPPGIVVCDSGSEFKAAFERGCEAHGVLQHVVEPENPWKNAMAERHGGFLKDRLEQELLAGGSIVQDWSDLDDFLHELTSTKNRWLNKGGQTPIQLVFGQLPRVPGELLADDHPGLMALQDSQEDLTGADQATAEYRRSMTIRERARQAAMAQASWEAINRAVRASTHQARDWRPGQWVYVYRRGKGNILHPRDR